MVGELKGLKIKSGEKAASFKKKYECVFWQMEVYGITQLNKKKAKLKKKLFW